jgi:hypothetical protein
VKGVSLSQAAVIALNGLKPYLFPSANIEWFFFVSFVELLLPLWLVITGWRINMRSDVATH